MCFPPSQKKSEAVVLTCFSCVPACMLSHFSHVRLFTTPWIVAHQAPLSVGFSRQEYWSKLPCPPPGDLPDPGTEPISLMSPALAGRFFTTSTTWEAFLRNKSKLTVFPGGPAIKNPSANEGDMGSISGQEDPTCYGATKASRHNYFAATKMIKE